MVHVARGSALGFGVGVAAGLLSLSVAHAQPTGPIPAPPEGCRVWEAHITSVIERHKRDGSSEAALGQALSIAYALYGKCVMCATDQEMNKNAVSALQRIQLVLSANQEVANADTVIQAQEE